MLKEIYDRHGEPFKVGDCVMLYTPVVPRGHCKKLQCLWSGPYKVLKKLSEVTYKITQQQRLLSTYASHYLQDTPHRQYGDVTGLPENFGSRQECKPMALIPDVDDNGDSIMVDMEGVELDGLE